jgi:hypothetical protein
MDLAASILSSYAAAGVVDYFLIIYATAPYFFLF